MTRKISSLWLLVFSFLFIHKAHAQSTDNTLIWKISGNGLEEDSYLYGTMHVADERAFVWVEKSMPFFEQCDQYAMELNPNEADPASVMQLMMLPEGTTLKDLFEEDDYHELHAWFKEEMNVDIAAFGQYSPFFVYSIAQQAMYGNQMSEAMDLHFNKLATQKGMEVIGLETVEEQISAINAMDMEDQAEMLMGLTKGKKSQKESKKLMKLYVKGRLNDMMEYANSSDEWEEDFATAMVDDRNGRMADRLPAILSEGSTFVAVGALHLPGEQGLIQLLRDKGYTVTPLNP